MYQVDPKLTGTLFQDPIFRQPVGETFTAREADDPDDTLTLMVFYDGQAMVWHRDPFECQKIFEGNYKEVEKFLKDEYDLTCNLSIPVQ